MFPKRLFVFTGCHFGFVFSGSINIDCDNHCCHCPKRHCKFVCFEKLIEKTMNVIGSKRHQNEQRQVCHGFIFRSSVSSYSHNEGYDKHSGICQKSRHALLRQRSEILAVSRAEVACICAYLSTIERLLIRPPRRSTLSLTPSKDRTLFEHCQSTSPAIETLNV